MKNPKFKFAFAALTAGIVLTSCVSSTDKVEASKVKVKVAQENLDKAELEYKKFKAESDAKIAANDKLIADLKMYSNAQKAEVKEEYNLMVTNLEAKNEELKQEVTNQKALGSKKWESFKSEFNHDMEELGNALRDLNKNNVKETNK